LNNCGTEAEKPDQVACDEISEDIRDEISDKDGGCDAKWQCGEWGECESSYTLKEVLEEEVSTSGFKSRNCVDTTECANDRIERRPCSVSVPIDAETVEWCEETYIEIYEKDTKKLVSRVKEKEEETMSVRDIGKLDISFITTEFTGFCDYCYNGVQDYDETGVDCGGDNCPECIILEDYVDWLPWLTILLWASIITTSGTVIWIQRRELLSFYQELGRQKMIPGLKGVKTMALKQVGRPKRVISVKESKLAKEKKESFMKALVSKITPKKRRFAGTPKTRIGIRETKPELKEKGGLRLGKGYSQQQKAKKEFKLAKKIREAFERKPKAEEKPVKEALTKIKKKTGVSKAKQGIRETRKKLRGEI
jgi:hypothetical protein